MAVLEYDAFISYASHDFAAVEEIYRHLTSAGFRVWFDKARLNPGCDWHREIEAACEASRVILPVLTPRWKLSEWTKFETYGAEAAIPLIVEGGIADVFTPPLTRFQGQAISLNASEDATWQRLFAALRSLLTRPAPDKMERLIHVRYRANPYFVGRERELNQIHEELHQSPSAVLTQGQVRAVTALGGVGKTTLARQYLEKFWRCYRQIFWIDCRLGIETEFARVCDLLLPEQEASTNVVEKAQSALRVLETRDDCFLVLDNADDEISIQSWIPRTGHCRTLITSRFAHWSAAIKTIHLYVLEPVPARTLLTTRAGREFEALSATEQSECERLAKDLGYLPLALEQAAAYVQQQGSKFSFADYVRLYGTATAELLAAGVLGSTEYPDSVITTWKATAAKLSSAGRGILRLCGFLSSAPIPIWALFEGVELIRAEAEAVAGSPLRVVSEPEVWIREQVAQLSAYSMVDGDGQSLSVHPLVQTVERLQLDELSGARRATLTRSLQWLNAGYVGDPEDVRSWPRLDPLTPHALAVAAYADKVGIWEPTDLLMSKAAILSLSKAQYAEAEVLMRRVVAIGEDTLGQDHPSLANSLSNLATLLLSTNRMGEAEPLMRRALLMDEQTYGPEHPNVGIKLGNLAWLLKSTNRIAEAELLMRRVVKIFEKSYGSNHPNVATTLNNLALLLQDTKRLAEAEPLMRKALIINEQIYGAEHPKVALSLINLATLLKETNRLEDAEPLMRRALRIDEQSYGMSHPNVALDLSNLASLLRATNRLEEAEVLMRRALLLNEESFGADHPDVAIDLNNLALLLQSTNRLAEAEPLMRRHLEIFFRFTVATRHEHPHLQSAVVHYVELLQAMGRSGQEIQAQLNEVARPFGIQFAGK